MILFFNRPEIMVWMVCCLELNDRLSSIVETQT